MSIIASLLSIALTWLHPWSWCLYTFILLLRIFCGAWNSSVTNPSSFSNKKSNHTGLKRYFFFWHIFECNNYPVNITVRSIINFLDKLYTPKQIVPTVPTKWIVNCSSIFSEISHESEDKFVQICHHDNTTMQLKVIFQSKNR